MENTYIINPWLFYFIDQADVIAGMVTFFGLILTLVGSIGYFYYFVEGHRDEDSYYFEKDKRYGKAFRFVLIIGIICLFIRIVVPTKETCYKMLIAKSLTKQTFTTTGKLVSDAIDDAVEKIIKIQNSKR